MGLKQIIGFLHEGQNLSATWGINTLTEQCLIEMDSPLEDVVDVQASLPAYDFGATAEPTFTIGLSYHPERTDLIFKQVNGVRVHEQGRPYWVIDLVYETGQWLKDIFPGEDNGRGNIPKKIRDTTGTAADPQEIIVQPWDEPVTWSSSVRSVRSTRYKSSAGDTLVHTNLLPLTEGIDVETYLEVHQFTWNVNATGFNYITDVAPYIGKINDSTIFDFDNHPPKHILLESVTCVENYRTVDLAGTKETFHFFTLNATFVIDARTDTVSPEGFFREANRRVSMHTQQLTFALIGITLFPMYTPIPVNDRGDFAQSPWPLDADGAAIPYDEMDTVNPETDFGIIDPLYPIEADLEQFITDNGLAIP